MVQWYPESAVVPGNLRTESSDFRDVPHHQHGCLPYCFCRRLAAAGRQASPPPLNRRGPRRNTRRRCCSRPPLRRNRYRGTAARHRHRWRTARNPLSHVTDPSTVRLGHRLFRHLPSQITQVSDQPLIERRATPIGVGMQRRQPPRSPRRWSRTCAESVTLPIVRRHAWDARRCRAGGLPFLRHPSRT